MLAFIKNRGISFALLLWFTVVFLISYFSLSRMVEVNLAPQLPGHPAKTQRMPDSPAPRKFPGPASLDADNDGFPDLAELHTFTDRENFRRWFAGLAEMQFYRVSDQWNVEQRDCAGLVRFAWREALRRHDRAWFQKMGRGYDAIASDASTTTLDQSPLGTKLFRTDFGTYRETDLANGKFSEFADARTLRSFNCKFISRDRHQAEPGDLLFFYQPWVQKFPYHVMIFLGRPEIAAAGANDWVVYHTGSAATDAGAIKKVELGVLDHHPNKRWRPVESNPNFLGFYRLKILN